MMERVVEISFSPRQRCAAPSTGCAAARRLGWVALLCGVALGQDGHDALFNECHARHSQNEEDRTCCIGDDMPCDVTAPDGSRRRLAAVEQHPPWEVERRRLGHCCDGDLFCQCLEGTNTCSERQRETAGCDGPAGLCCPQPLEISSHATPLQNCSASSWMRERVPSLPPSLFSVSTVTATDDWTQLSFVSAVPGSVSVGNATVQLSGELLPPSDRGDCGSYDESQWVVCAAEHSECSCPSGLVRYGSFHDATGQLVEQADGSGGTWTEWVPFEDGTVHCSNAVFGDPLVGVRKECHCQVPTVSSDMGIFTAQVDACDVLCLQQAASSPMSSESSRRPCARHALRFGQGDSEYELQLTFGGKSPGSSSTSSEPGTYTLMAWVKVTIDYDGRPQMLHSRFWDPNGAELGITSDGWPSTLGEWERISVMFDTGTTRPARMTWYVGYNQGNTVGNTYITELQVMGPSGEAMLADGSFGGGQHMSSWSEENSYGEYAIIELPRHPCGATSLGRGVPISSTVPVWAASSGPSGSQLLYGDVRLKHLEVGQVIADHTPVTVRYTEDYVEPVIICGIPTQNGDEGAIVRIREHSSTERRVQLYVDTPNHAGMGEVCGRDTAAHAESFSWLIIDTGDTGAVEAGRVSSSSTTTDAFQWLSVGFLRTLEGTPVVISQIMTHTGDDWIKTRHRNVSPSGFNLKMEEDGLDTGHNQETIGWIALPAGTDVLGGLAYEAINTDASVTHAPHEIIFSRSFQGLAPPALFGSIQTFNGGDPAHLRQSSPATAEGATVFVEEETCSDLEIDHSPESLSLLAINLGRANVSGGNMMLFSHLNYRAGLNPTSYEASARITSLTDENVIVRRHSLVAVPEIDGITRWVLQAGETAEILRLQTDEYFTASGAAYGVVQHDDIMCDAPATALVEPMLSSSFAGTRFVVDGLKQQHYVDDGPIRAGDLVYELFASCLRDVCELQIGGMSQLTSVSSGSMERVDLAASRLLQHFPDGPLEIVSSAPLVAALHAFPLTIPLTPASTTLYGVTSAAVFSSSPAPLLVGTFGTFGTWENGFCVDIDGRDVNDLVYTLTTDEGYDSPEKKQECLELCAAEPQYVGCEVIWDQGNAGCYGHASTAVVSGNGNARHSCSIREVPPDSHLRQENECRNVGEMWACRYQVVGLGSCPPIEVFSCFHLQVLGAVLWGVHWCCWNFEKYREHEVRWQDNCNHIKVDYYRRFPHHIPPWRQVLLICTSCVGQVICGAFLRTQACGKSGWGIAHIIIGSLTTVTVPCFLKTKCIVGSRHRPIEPQQPAIAAQAAAAQMRANGEVGEDGATLVRSSSIPLVPKLPPSAGSNVRLRMEKPLSPETVTLQVDSSGLEYTTIECTTCAGTGMIAHRVYVAVLAALPEGQADESITWKRFTNPPTVSDVARSSSLYGKVQRGDVVLRVGWRIRGDCLSGETADDELVRLRTAAAGSEPFDCAELSGEDLTARLRDAIASTTGDAEAEEIVFTLRSADKSGRGGGGSSGETPMSCFVCQGKGSVSALVKSLKAPEGEGDHPCEVCYGDSKFGMSTDCLHFYCEACIRGSLEAIMDTGQFPAYCPACRAESTSGGHAEPTHGRIEGPALTFLQQRGVITLDFQMRILAQCEKADGVTQKFFKCPGPDCQHYLIDQDPQYSIVPRGTTEVEGFERKMRLGKCECGARVCVRCHALAELPQKPALTKLAEVMKEELSELLKEGGVSHWSTMQMDEIAGLLSVGTGDAVKVDLFHDWPPGDYVVKERRLNVRLEAELTSAQVRDQQTKQPVYLETGERVTVFEARKVGMAWRVRHSKGWSSAVSAKSGRTLLEPREKLELDATLANAGAESFSVAWSEAAKAKLRSLQRQQPHFAQYVGSQDQGSEGTAAVGVAVPLPSLILISKTGFAHECPVGLTRQLSTDAETQALLQKSAKKCPNCGAFIQKNDGCNIMMCGTTAHGRLADALAHGGCGHLFHWDSLKPAKTYYIGLNGQRVDNYIGGVATDGGGAMP